MPVLKCECSNEYQDKKYGNNMRVHNQVKTPSGQDVYVCTVCGDNKQYTFGGKTIGTMKRKKK